MPLCAVVTTFGGGMQEGAGGTVLRGSESSVEIGNVTVTLRVTELHHAERDGYYLRAEASSRGA